MFITKSGFAHHQFLFSIWLDLDQWDTQLLGPVNGWPSCRLRVQRCLQPQMKRCCRRYLELSFSVCFNFMWVYTLGKISCKLSGFKFGQIAFQAAQLAIAAGARRRALAAAAVMEKGKHPRAAATHSTKVTPDAKLARSSTVSSQESQETPMEPRKLFADSVMVHQEPC